MVQAGKNEITTAADKRLVLVEKSKPGFGGVAVKGR